MDYVWPAGNCLLNLRQATQVSKQSGGWSHSPQREWQGIDLAYAYSGFSLNVLGSCPFPKFGLPASHPLGKL